MKVRIDIDTRTFVRFWLVMFGFGFAILAIYSARTALIIIGVALFLALALNGPVSSLARWLPGKSRAMGTAIAFTIVILLLGAVLFLVVPPIAQQTAKFIDSVPSLVDNASKQWHGVGDLIDKYHIQPQVDSAVVSLKNSAGSWAANFGQNILTGAGTALSVFAGTILTLVLTFLMLIEGPEWLRRLWELYNDEHRMKNHQRLVGRIHAVVSGYVTGQLTVSGIDGMVSGLAVFIISLFIPAVPQSLAFPTIAIAFTLSLIPMFGATVGGVIVALLLAINSPIAAIAYIIYFVIYQQIENNFISPAIQSRRIELSPLAVLASVTVGLYVFGIIGGIISIPIAGSLKVLLEEYLERSEHKREEAEKPLAKLVKKLQGEED